MPRKTTPAQVTTEPEPTAPALSGDVIPVPKGKAGYLRGKYPPGRFPMLEAHPNINPGDSWEIGTPLPDGFRLDKSNRIWPIPVRAGRVAPDEKRCVGTNKDGTGRCPMYKVSGRETCRMHGDTQANGIAHPNLKHGGRASRGIFGNTNMPETLSKFFDAFYENPEVFDLTNNVVLRAGREEELVGGLSSGEARASWKKAGELFDEFYDAVKAKDEETANATGRELRILLRRGRTDTAIWSELQNVGERKRKAIETYRKIQRDMNAFVSAQQLRALLRNFSVIVGDEVTNLPVYAQTLIRNEGHLDMGRLCQLLTAQMGGRLAVLCEGMKGGKLSEEADAAGGNRH